MKLTGVLKTFDHQKGFGFITRDDRLGDVFLHAQELRESGIEAISLCTRATRLEFDTVERGRGLRAQNVKVLA